MVTVARLAQGGDLLLADEVDERLPQVKDGLLMHMPMDGQSGTFDIVGGVQPLYNQLEGVNLADLLGWRDPANWCPINNETGATSTRVTWDDTEQAIRFTGPVNTTLRIPIVIDYTKTYTVSMDIYVEDKTNGTGTWRLYIGGNREDDTNTRTTVNYDYSIKSNFKPALEVLTHVTKTYTPGDVRYMDGWKAQIGSASGDDAFTRYWWFGGLWNYTGAITSKTLLKNLRITVTDTDTTNVVMDKNGLHNQPASRNMVPNPDFSDITTPDPDDLDLAWDDDLHAAAIKVNNWSSGYNAGITSPETGYHAHFAYAGSKPWKVYGKSPCIVLNDENEQLLGLGHRWLGVNVNMGTASSNSISIGDTISVSWNQRTDNIGKGAKVGLYHKLISTGSNSFGTTLTHGYNTKAFTWERVGFTTVVDSDWDLTGDVRFYVYGYYGSLYGRVWVEEPQAEILTFPSTFIPNNTSRTAAGANDFKFPTDYLDYTVGSLVLKMTPLDFTRASYVDMFDCTEGTISSNNFLILRKNASSSVPNTMYIRNGSIWSFDSSISTYLTAGEESVFIWTWEVGGTYQLIIDGTVIKTGSYSLSDRVASNFKIGLETLVSSFSLYDRVLTDDEIAKLSGKSLQIGSTGILTTDEIIEPQPDFTSPLAAYNLAHSPKNLIDPEFVSFTNDGSNTTKDFFGQTITVRDMSNDANWECRSPHVDIDPNTWYQFSIWIYVEDKTVGQVYLGMDVYNSSDVEIDSYTETGAKNRNQYFRYCYGGSTTELVQDRWVQWKGYLLPDSVRATDGVPSYLKEGWFEDEGGVNLTIDPERIIFMGTSAAKTLLRFLDYYNNGTMSTSYFALPCITAMEPLRVFDSGTINTNRLLEKEEF